jgi:hypothetical protein
MDERVELADGTGVPPSTLIPSPRTEGVTDEGGEAAVAALPEGWGRTLTGEPMPDVVAAVRRSRATR